MTPPNSKQPQFIESGSTGVETGKKANTNIGNKKIIEAMLTAIPYRPSDHRRAGSGSPRNRLYIKQPIVKIYDDIKDEIVMELIALRATVEPILISETNATITSDTIIALSGMFIL